MRKLKVFGGLTFSSIGRRQVRTIVAATSQKRAAELVNMSLHEFREYWSETGNPAELATALACPEDVFVASSTMGDDFMPAPVAPART